jgi:chemotaxis protein CheX
MKTLQAEIVDIVQMIWSTLIDVPIEPDGIAPPADASTVTGVVNIDGAWRGTVLVRCPLALATLLTGAMLKGDDEPTLEEVSDAMGELTNMVAGNTKALLPQPSAISLPTVAFGSQNEIGETGTRTIATVAFRSTSYPLVVSVVQHSADGPVQP